MIPARFNQDNQRLLLTPDRRASQSLVFPSGDTENPENFLDIAKPQFSSDFKVREQRNYK